MFIIRKTQFSREKFENKIEKKNRNYNIECYSTCNERALKSSRSWQACYSRKQTYKCQLSNS